MVMNTTAACTKNTDLKEEKNVEKSKEGPDEKGKKMNLELQI